MKHEDHAFELTELGTVTGETKGAAVGIFDHEGTLYWPTGLRDD